MKSRGICVVNKFESTNVEPPAERIYKEVELEEALNIAGAGRYQLIHCTMMFATLSSALLEMIGTAFVLPAAACDLNIPENLRGILTSVPNLGIILTAPFWGRFADSRGRRPVLLWSTAAAGIFGLAAAFTSSLIAFTLCKLGASLFLSCPSSLGYAYASELVPQKRRDLAMLIFCGFLMMYSTFSPLLAWGILPLDLSFKPWRLLTAVYAIPLLLTALWLVAADESPKFLVSRRRGHEALKVLRKVHAVNSGLPADTFCVTSLKPDTGDSAGETSDSSSSALALLRPPHLKWMALTSFLLFGVFSLLNGLFLFAPDTINRVMSSSDEGSGTLCMLMNSADNQTSTECVETMSHETFSIMVTSTAAYGVVVMAGCLCPVSKQTLLVSMFTTVGAACLLAGTLTHRIIAGVCMSALQLTALGVGPLTAYAVHLFPTSLRGTAVGAVLMMGRLGSVVGANASGVLLGTACEATFYGFSALLFLCAALSFLLPKDEPARPANSDEER